MEGLVQALIEGIERWRLHNVDDYWIRVDYMGAELNRLGDHVLTYVHGKLWHHWHGAWREVEKGSDFWLFSVPGGFAWARDVLTKIIPATEVGDEAIELRFNDEYGYVEYMRVKVAKRDAHNFTLEIKGFGVGPHAEF